MTGGHLDPEVLLATPAVQNLLRSIKVQGASASISVSHSPVCHALSGGRCYCNPTMVLSAGGHRFIWREGRWSPDGAPARDAP